MFCLATVAIYSRGHKEFKAVHVYSFSRGTSALLLLGASALVPVPRSRGLLQPLSLLQMTRPQLALVLALVSAKAL